MSEPKHTAGPWTYEEQDPRTFSGMEAWSKTFQVNSVRENEAQEEYIGFALKKQNAALMCAAPDLLEALKRCLPEWVYTEDYSDIPDHKIAAELTMGDLRTILAAIAKAQPEGKQ